MSMSGPNNQSGSNPSVGNQPVTLKQPVDLRCEKLVHIDNFTALQEKINAQLAKYKEKYDGIVENGRRSGNTYEKVTPLLGEMYVGISKLVAESEKYIVDLAKKLSCAFNNGNNNKISDAKKFMLVIAAVDLKGGKNLDKIKEFFKALDTLSIEDYLATVRSFVIYTLRGTGQNKYTIKNVCKISPTRRRSMYNEALSTASNVSDTWYNTNNNEGHGVSF